MMSDDRDAPEWSAWLAQKAVPRGVVGRGYEYDAIPLPVLPPPEGPVSYAEERYSAHLFPPAAGLGPVVLRHGDGRVARLSVDDWDGLLCQLGVTNHDLEAALLLRRAFYEARPDLPRAQVGQHDLWSAR